MMKKMMMVLLVGGVVSGCSKNDPVYGDEICEYTETAVPWSDEAPNGVVPGDVFDGLSTTATVEADEAPSANEELSVMIERDGDVAFYLESDACQPRLALPLIFSVTTVTGDALDEAFALQGMVNDSGDRVSVSHGFAASDLNGTYAPSVDGASDSVMGLVLSADVGPTNSDARILVNRESRDGNVVTDSVETAWSWSW